MSVSSQSQDQTQPEDANRADAIRASGQWSVMRRLMPYLWPKDRPDLRRRVAYALVALLIAKAATVTVPFFYKWAVDTLTGVDGGSAAAPDFTVGLSLATAAVALTIGYGLARLLSSGFQQLRDGLFARVGQHAQRTVTVMTFKHMHRLSLRFHLERRTGGLSRIIERGSQAIDFLLRYTLFSIVPTLIELALVCVVLGVKFSLVYSLVTAVTMGSFIWFTFTVTEWRLKLRREMNRTDTEANTKAVDSLLNFETVKYFNNEAYEQKRFDVAAAAYEKAATKSNTSLSWLNFGQAVIFTGGLVTLMVMASFEVAAGTMTLGDFVMINAFLMQIAVPLNMLGFVYREIKQSLIDLEKMFGILDVAPEVEDRPDAGSLRVESGSVSFETVAFAYDLKRPILHGLSLEVPGGKSVAIVGPSGAGKSTIARLLYRFYDVQSGRILIDGQDIAGLAQASVRDAIGIVPQDTVLFNDTIRYNIRYGRPDASDAEVEAAAKMAQIHEFIGRLPDGYETLVGERGLKLSGGEKQRVAIARTILKNPPILILDEATSALDSHTEQAILHSLYDLARERTTIMIAHRLSTVVDADEIIVLDGGQIAERGDHASLIAQGGLYADLWDKQSAVQEAERIIADTAAE